MKTKQLSEWKSRAQASASKQQYLTLWNENKFNTHTWLTGAREVASFTPLPDVSAGAVVATRSVVAGVIFLTKNPGVAIFALAEEGALQKSDSTQISRVKSGSPNGETAGGRKDLWNSNNEIADCEIIQRHNNAIMSSGDTVWFSQLTRENRRNGTKPDTVRWPLQHLPLYTFIHA